jgi:hypothetical protein
VTVFKIGILTALYPLHLLQLFNFMLRHMECLLWLFGTPNAAHGMTTLDSSAAS